MNKKIIIGAILLSGLANAQTAAERAKIASQSDQEANKTLLTQLLQEDLQRKQRLQAYIAAHPGFKPVLQDDANGKVEVLDVLPSGEFVFAKTDNAGAAVTARANKLYSGGGMGLNIQGQNMIAGVWDGGSILQTHQEFTVNGLSKVEVLDGGTVDDHATHVGGTIAAQGIYNLARGIAFNSSLKSYDWTSDFIEMTGEASAGLLVSNHSYSSGQLSSIWYYGAYDTRARQMDVICNNNPFYLPVLAAGNSRGETNVNPAMTQYNNKSGYDMIFGQGNAKNVLTVAAVGQVNNYVDASSVPMSSFSSWGPSDDGRIKPEISMKGVQVRSTLDTGDAAYGPMSGTSMASPGVTGVVTLLQQYYNQLYSAYMRAATVKGLILHTADEAGETAGPDERFGWGLINAEQAAKTIRDRNLPLNGSSIQELQLTSGVPFTKTITANTLEPMRISISWTDPAAPSNAINSGVTDPTNKYLVNDLDLKLTSVATGEVFYPWRLAGGMTTPGDGAVNNGPNNVDNFERIDLEYPSGAYTITVTNKGTFSTPQKFTLIITGKNLSLLSTQDAATNTAAVRIYPNPAANELFFSGASAKSTVKIIDQAGRLVKSGMVEDSKFDISSLSKGVYQVIFKNMHGEDSNFKFIKK